MAVIMYSCAAQEDKIYEWRTNERDGIFDEENLLKEWPEEGPQELWVIEGLGNGYGSPTFTETHFYITGEKDSVTNIYCYSIEGEKIWETKLGREWMKTFPGTRSAPTIVGDLLYLVNGYGHIYCLETGTGDIVWWKNFYKDFQGIETLHGISEAPVIEGDKVFYTPGGEEHNVVALNRFDGELVWTNPGVRERSGYNQGKLIELGERNIFVTFSAYHLLGFDSETGELLWSHEQDNYTPEQRKLGLGDTHCNSVIYDEGYIYYQAGDGNCGVKLKLSVDGSMIEEVWRNSRFNGYMGGIIKAGDYLYGSSGTKPDLLSVNSITGLTTDSLRIGIGALIAADNLFYYYEQRGVMRLVEYNEGMLKELSSFRIRKGTKEHFAHPVINRGILYQRHGDVLIAYDIRQK